MEQLVVGVWSHICISRDMVVYVKTTINLPDGLADMAKRRAAERGCTFTALVVEGLHHVLSEVSEVRRAPLPIWGSASDQVLVDPADNEALGSALDADGWK